MPTIFYSWQSDRPNSANRGFIGKALETAASHLKDLPHVYAIDRDTAGVAGAPEIHHAIFGKIDAAAAFVADVTYVGAARNRLLPNPNVLVELGYALARLGPFRVVQVLNKSYGSVDRLPFDVKMRRTIVYKLDESVTGDQKLKERSKLAKGLEEALRLILKDDATAAPGAKRPELRIIGELRVVVDSGGSTVSWRISGRAALKAPGHKLDVLGSDCTIAVETVSGQRIEMRPTTIEFNRTMSFREAGTRHGDSRELHIESAGEFFFAARLPAHALKDEDRHHPATVVLRLPAAGLEAAEVREPVNPVRQHDYHKGWCPSGLIEDFR